MTIKEIYENKNELIALKKAAIKHSDVCVNIPLKELSTNKEVIINGFDGLQKVVANTYYWLDSHGDVHVKGCFTKSIKENIGKIFHLDSHDSSAGFRSKVANVKEVLELEVPWSAFGKQKDGNTICLIGVSELIEDYNKQVYDAYKNGEVDQHSVGMIYKDITLAINDPEYDEEYRNWLNVYPLLGNPEKADEEGYFWVIKQAALKEYSCLLWDGSNILTPSAKENIEPSNDTHESKEADNSHNVTLEQKTKISIYNFN